MKEFTEEQVKEIISKAAAMQKNSLSQKTESGLTMAELIEIGKESGLDESFIKTAALDFENNDIAQHSDLSDTHIFEERTFKTSLSEDIIWGEITSELSHHFGGSAFGKTKFYPGEKKWSHMSISGIESIASLKLHDNIAKLKFSQRVGLGAPLTEGIMYGAGLTFLIMMVAAPLTDFNILFILSLSSSLFILSSILIYKLDILWRNKKLKNLSNLANKIVSQLPKNITSLKSKRMVPDNTSSIEIESEDVYTNEVNLRNSLREKE